MYLIYFFPHPISNRHNLARAVFIFAYICSIPNSYLPNAPSKSPLDTMRRFWRVKKTSQSVKSQRAE